jgi:hypothetical protein
VIDLSEKRTEWEWSVFLYRLFSKATPIWFDWIKWIMILAALKLIAEKANSGVLEFVVWFSCILLGFYFLAFFDRMWLRGVPYIQTGKRQWLVPATLAVLLALGANWCVGYLVKTVATFSK